MVPMGGRQRHRVHEVSLHDVLALYFLDPTIASAFVARWCAMQRVEIVVGVYQVRMTK